jgi:hypothetical protein
MSEINPKVDRVEETFNKLRYADRDIQEQACKAIEKEDGGVEVAAKLRELFESERAKFEERAAEIEKEIEKEEEPRKAAISSVSMEALKKTVAGMKPKLGINITLLTADQKKERIAELAEIFQSDKTEERLRYNTRKAEVAEELEVQQMDVHRAVQLHIDKEKKEKRNLTQSQKIVSLVLNDSNIELWIDPMDRAPYVSIIVDKHCENYRIGDGAFEAWVRAEYGRRHWTEIDGCRVPAVMSSATLHEGIATMKGMAATRKEVMPALRVGGTPGEVWLDLGTRDWELVKVTKGGWRIVTEGVPSVRFVRKPGTLALPIPVPGGNIQELRPFLNVRDDDFVLNVGWLLGALRPTGPYPLLCITGIAGMAKTSACRVLQRLIDPNFADLRPFKKEDDMYIGAFNSWILAFDNISRIGWEEADVLCRISTGIGYAKRQLRTDADQFMMRVCRPIVLNGIPNDLAERSDLADRSIVQELPALDEENLKYEEEFWREFEGAKPRILGALLYGVAGALSTYSGIDLRGHGRVRMADFARWAEAGCRSLGFKEEEFLDAFTANQGRAMRIAFDRDYVAKAVALLIEQSGGRWAGNTKPLLPALRKALTKGGEGDLLWQKGWPENPTWLGRQLRRSAAVLRKVCDIQIEFDVDLRKTGEGDKDGLVIRKRTTPIAVKIEMTDRKVVGWRRI